MLNFFTCPKPSTGHIGQIQQKAIDSWKQIAYEKRILIINEADICRTLGGAPRVDDIFRLARGAVNQGFLIYSNADICFDNSLLKTIGYTLQAKLGKEWLIVGATHNEDGTHRGQAAIDWAIFTRNAIDKDMPPFALGRVAWDNWLILQAISRGIPTIDASQVLKATHLNHDYSHIEGGFKETREGEDAKRNLSMAGGMRAHTGRIDATPYYLDADGVLWGRYNAPVDVITATVSGREKYLERCKASVKAQDYPSELINHIILEDKKGGQRSKVRNDAIKSGSAPYVFYVDDDDVLMPNHVSTLINYMEFNRTPVAYTLGYKVPEDDTMTINGPIELEWNQLPHEPVTKGNFTPLPCVAHRRECLEDIGYWNEELDVLEDFELLIRLHNKYGMHKIERVTCWYSVRESGTIANPEYNEKKWAAAKYIKEKYS